MIESNIIKRYAIKTFTQNNQLGIDEIANLVMQTLSSKLFLNESVILLETRQQGKVQYCSNGLYRILLDDGSEKEVKFEELRRKNTVGLNDVVAFLCCATQSTPFGRVLIENVLEKIKNPNFGLEASLYGDCNYGSGSARGYNTSRYSTSHTDEPKGRVRRAARERPEARTSRPEDGPEHEASTKRHRSKKDASEPLNLHQLKFQPIKEELDFSSLKQFTIKDIAEADLKKMVKIYSFCHGFRAVLGLGDFEMADLASSITDPDVSSELLFKIFAVLVGLIEKEIKVKKERFYEASSFIREALPAFTTDSVQQIPKKRTQMTMDNWKAQVKIFIQNIRADNEDDRVLRFLGFSKKDGLLLRLDLIIFMIDLVMFTEKFRDIVAEFQSKLRAERAEKDKLTMQRKKRGENTRETKQQLSEGIRKCTIAILNHPLRVHLGMYKNYSAIMLDGKVLLKDNDLYYYLEKKDIAIVLRNLDLNGKEDKFLANNLKSCIECLL